MACEETSAVSGEPEKHKNRERYTELYILRCLYSRSKNENKRYILIFKLSQKKLSSYHVLKKA